jgi:hypothetical protein
VDGNHLNCTQQSAISQLDICGAFDGSAVKLEMSSSSRCEAPGRVA